MDKRVEKFIENRKKLLEKGGKFMAVKTVGQIVLNLVASDIEPTVENITAAIKDKISATQSARGQLDHELDLDRLSLEEALSCIENKIRSPE